MSKSYDLSTSTKWANLADGEHVVKIKARGSGYGTSSFSNSVTVTKGVVAMPVKGDLITIESKQYRVLKTNGFVAEVLAMYNSTDSQIFGSNSTYAGSDLDTYCNSTFYGTLSSAIQTAIVDKTFTQDKWSNTDGTSGGSGSAIYQGVYSSYPYRLGLVDANYGESISRKCYVLSVQDIIDYLEVTIDMNASNTTLKPANIQKMFWDVDTSPGSSTAYTIKVRSTKGYDVFLVNGAGGYVTYGTFGYKTGVRPAFQIDLSKIEWSPVGGGN